MYQTTKRPHWNYRICKHTTLVSNQVVTVHCVREVHYDADGAISGWGPPRVLTGDEPADLVDDLALITESLTKHPEVVDLDLLA